MSNTQNASISRFQVCDAYCHVGIPRFGSAEDALKVADQWQITNCVLVLGPGVPDYQTLFHAMRTYKNRVRGVGIPFGDNQAQVEESVLLQLDAGVLGLRVEPAMLLKYPSILQHLGERGRWLYAIGAVDNVQVIHKLVQWLEKYPDTHIAAPHFLKPHPLYEPGDDHGLVRALVSHQHFHPIFSRHGGMGSREPYPHKDFTRWVEQVLDTAGWHNVLWGSEYPVYSWRDETMGTCLQWLYTLLEHIREEQRASYLYQNGQRLFFEQSIPHVEMITIPDWIDEQFKRDRTVPLFPTGLHVPMLNYLDLHHRYVDALGKDPDLKLSSFAMQLLKQA